MEFTAFAMAAALYEAAQPAFTSACASAIVIFSGVCAISNGMNSCQCFGRVRRPANSRRLYNGVAGNGVSKPKMGRPGGQVWTSFKVLSATPVVSLSIPKIKEVMAVDVADGQPLEHGSILARLVEAFVDAGEIRRVDGFHTDEDPLTAGSGNQVDELLIAKEVGADLRHPMDLGTGRDDVSQQRFGAFGIDGEIVVDKKDGDLASFTFCARFQQQEFVDNALICRNRMESPKKPVTVQNSQP